MSEEAQTIPTPNLCYSNQIQNQTEIEKELIFLKQTVNQLAINYEKAIMEIIELKKEKEDLLKIKSEYESCLEKIAELEKAVSAYKEEKPTESIKNEEQVEEEPEIALVASGARPVAEKREFSQDNLDYKTKENLLESKNAQLSLFEKELSLLNKELEEQKKLNEELKLKFTANSNNEQENNEDDVINCQPPPARIGMYGFSGDYMENIPGADNPLDQEEIDAGIIVSENPESKKYQQMIILLEEELTQKSNQITKMETDFAAEKEKLSSEFTAKIKVSETLSRTEADKSGKLAEEKKALEKQVEDLKAELAKAKSEEKTFKTSITSGLTNPIEQNNTNNNINAAKVKEGNANFTNLTNLNTSNTVVNSQDYNKAAASIPQTGYTSTGFSSQAGFYPNSYTNYSGLNNYAGNTYFSGKDYTKLDIVSSSSSKPTLSANTSSFLNGFGENLVSKSLSSGLANKYISSNDFSSNYQNNTNTYISQPDTKLANQTNNNNNNNKNDYYTGLINQNIAVQQTNPAGIFTGTSSNASASNGSVYSNYLNDYSKNTYTNSSAFSTNVDLTSNANSAADLQKKVASETDEIIARVLKGSTTSSNNNLYNFVNLPVKNYAEESKASDGIMKIKSVYETVSGENTYRSSINDSQSRNPNASIYKSTYN